MTRALSQQSLEEWEAFARSAGSDMSGPLDRDLFHQFLIGVYRRGEVLLAHELKTLVDQMEVGTELARELMAFAGPAMALLEAYDRCLAPVDDDDDDDSEAAFVGDADVGPGILVI